MISRVVEGEQGFFSAFVIAIDPVRDGIAINLEDSGDVLGFSAGSSQEDALKAWKDFRIETFGVAEPMLETPTRCRR